MKNLLASAALIAITAMPVVAQDADTVLASVDGVDITIGHVIALRARLPQEYQALPDEVLYNGIVDQLVQQQVLAAYAEQNVTAAMELAVENEVRALMAGLLLQQESAAEIPDADIQAAYNATFANSAPEQEFNASHILVETEEEAASLVTQLGEGADFAELARTFSTGPSGPNGGNLGWFGLGQMVPAFEQAVLGLDVGAVSAPVQTQFGWHVVILNDRREVGAPPLEEVRESLIEDIAIERRTAFIEGLMGAAEVTRAEVEVDPAIIRNNALIAE